MIQLLEIILKEKLLKKQSYFVDKIHFNMGGLGRFVWFSMK